MRLTCLLLAESRQKLDSRLEIDVSKEAYQEAAACALKSADESYTPYTRCPAGVAIISDRGVHSGGIVENAAHNPTLQPLQAALINARFEGLTEYHRVRTIFKTLLRKLWGNITRPRCNARNTWKLILFSDPKELDF